MTVGELLSRISSRELSEWMEYAKLEPFGEERADLRAAIVAATVANASRRRRKPFEVRDFMPRFESSQRKTPAQLLQIVEILNTALGGKDLRT